MTIRLEESNSIHIPISLKNDEGIYTMKLTHSQNKETITIELTDFTPLNRFATFYFDGVFEKGSYTYIIEDVNGLVRKGIAYNFEPSNINNKVEYNPDKEIYTYE